jgi:hypothetical protein
MLDAHLRRCRRKIFNLILKIFYTSPAFEPQNFGVEFLRQNEETWNLLLHFYEFNIRIFFSKGLNSLSLIKIISLGNPPIVL